MTWPRRGGRHPARRRQRLRGVLGGRLVLAAAVLAGAGAVTVAMRADAGVVAAAAAAAVAVAMEAGVAVVVAVAGVVVVAVAAVAVAAVAVARVMASSHAICLMVCLMGTCRWYGLTRACLTALRGRRRCSSAARWRCDGARPTTAGLLARCWHGLLRVLSAIGISLRLGLLPLRYSTRTAGRTTR